MGRLSDRSGEPPFGSMATTAQAIREGHVLTRSTSAKSSRIVRRGSVGQSWSSAGRQPSPPDLHRLHRRARSWSPAALGLGQA